MRCGGRGSAACSGQAASSSARIPSRLSGPFPDVGHHRVPRTAPSPTGGGIRSEASNRNVSVRAAPPARPRLVGRMNGAVVAQVEVAVGRHGTRSLLRRLHAVLGAEEEPDHLANLRPVGERADHLAAADQPSDCPSIGGNGNVSVKRARSGGILERTRPRTSGTGTASSRGGSSSIGSWASEKYVSAAAVGSADGPNLRRRRCRRTARKRAGRAGYRTAARGTSRRRTSRRPRRRARGSRSSRWPATRSASPDSKPMHQGVSPAAFRPTAESDQLVPRRRGSRGRRHVGARGSDTRPTPSRSARERAEEMTALGRPGPVSAQRCRGRRGTDSDPP